MQYDKTKPLIVAITGASGAIYGVRLLQHLRTLQINTILVISKMGFATIKTELGLSNQQVIKLADEYYSNDNLFASISSGSFLTNGMIVAPCSIKSLSGIANCYNDNLISRSADVCLKEKRTLVLMLRESPLHYGHLQLMQTINASGGILMPPFPAFYNHPKTIEDIVDHSLARCLDLFLIPHSLTERWQ